MLRGVNKQQIFECFEDYEQFAGILRKQCESGRCFIYAWCLMGNHVHLLLKEGIAEIGEIMKSISASYVYYYNHKYDRIGHLFQERFRSQPVDCWQYFLTLLRYIHQNPLKSQMVRNLSDYQWCSWHEYKGESKYPFCTLAPVLSRISMEELEKLIYSPLTDDEIEGLIDYESLHIGRHITDEEVWTIIRGICGADNLPAFQTLPRPRQKHILYRAHDLGVSTRTLSRLTGISYSVVQRATSGSEGQGHGSVHGSVHGSEGQGHGSEGQVH